MKFGYSEEGRVFMFENTPSVVKLSGIHLENINKVRHIGLATRNSQLIVMDDGAK